MSPDLLHISPSTEDDKQATPRDTYHHQDILNLSSFQNNTLDRLPYIYVISGYCDNPLSSVERLQIGCDHQSFWEPAGKLQHARTKFQSVVIPFDLVMCYQNVQMNNGQETV